MAVKTKQELENENDDLKKTLSQMQNQMEQMQSFMKQFMTPQSTQPQSDKIPMDEEIPVISCFEGRLTLTTEEDGKGSKYTFEKFGEIQDVPMDDLIKIVKSYKNTFVKSGYFQIMNDKAVKQLRLKSLYDKLFGVEEIEDMINSNADVFIEKYRKLSESQKEIVLDRILQRKFNEDNVDINILYTLGKEINRDLVNVQNPLKS